MKRQIEITFLETEEGFDYTVTMERDLAVILEEIKSNLAGGRTVITELKEVQK